MKILYYQIVNRFSRDCLRIIVFKSLMITKNLLQLDEAIDIAQTAIQCKRKKQYNLAKTYFTQAGTKLSSLLLGMTSFIVSLTCK